MMLGKFDTCDKFYLLFINYIYSHQYYMGEHHVSYVFNYLYCYFLDLNLTFQLLIKFYYSFGLIISTKI